MSFSRGQSEIHSKLLQDLGNTLTTENFEKLKNHCRVQEYGRFGSGQLEKIKSLSDLFQKLQQKAIFKEGDYTKLKNLLHLCENNEAVELVKEAEVELLKAGFHVVGCPFPGSSTPYSSGMQNPPPYAYAQSHYTHQSYVPPHVPRGPSGMGYQQFRAEPPHKSDAHPSMGHQSSFHYGDNRMSQPGNLHNPSTFVTPGPQFSGVNQPPSPMQWVSPGHMPNPQMQMMDNGEYYDTQHKGYILFINNYFKPTNGSANVAGYDNRDGAEKDTENLRTTCTNFLTNHEFFEEEEVGTNKFWGILDDARNKMERGNYSSFVLIISSHGIQKKEKKNGETFSTESIVLVDGNTVTLNEIIEKFNGQNAPSLIGKPKVFIIQACRGEAYGKGVPDKADSASGATAENVNEFRYLSRPENADILEAYATSSGTRAWRNAQMGTWYIHHLCQAINENSRGEHFLDLLIRVHRQIAALVTNTENRAKQMPCYMTTFTKKFRLF